MVKFVKTSQNNTYDPPAHPKHRFDVLHGNLNMDVTLMLGAFKGWFSLIIDTRQCRFCLINRLL